MVQLGEAHMSVSDQSGPFRAFHIQAKVFNEASRDNIISIIQKCHTQSTI